MTTSSKASPSAALRLVGAVTAIGALFFGFAAVAITGDSEVGLASGSTTTSTSSSTVSTTTISGTEPVLTSPSPNLERVTGPETTVIDGVGDGISPSTSIVASTAPTTAPSSTATTAPKSTTTAPTDSSTTPPPLPEVPDDAVVVNPGDNLQQLVNSHPAGTTFYLRAGVHKSPGGTRHVDPKSDNTFIGEPGAVMDGGGTTTFAFQDNMKGARVTIRGLIIQNYSTPTQRGAIDAGSGGWRVIGNEIRNNSGAAVSLGGSGWVIESNNIHHNEQIGIKGQGSGGRVVGNTIAYNNPDRRYDPAWEAGGTKFVNTTNLYVAGNKVLNNHGPGLWTDSNNQGTVYENNTVRDNYGPGIFHEISQSASIRNNTVTGNAHGFYVGGILVANSSDVTVTGNTVSGNDGGIIGLQDDRGSHNTVNLLVKNNTVSFSTGVQGLIHNSGTDVTQSGTILFDHNVYTTTVSGPFRWGKASLTTEEWRAIGQDIHSTFN